jgi:hypothetical protein
MDGSDLQELITGLKSPGCLQLDLKRQRMFWRVVSSPYDEIHHAQLDGTDHQITRLDQRYANHDKRQVPGHGGMFAIEPMDGKFYFVSRPPRICRCNYDGTLVEDIVELGLSEYVTICVDGAGGHLYWADKERGEIHRSNLDGSAVRTIYSHLGNKILGIVFDDVLRKLYWTETEVELRANGRDVLTVFNSMCRANTDGSQRERLVVVDTPIYVGTGFLLPHGKLFDIFDKDGMYSRFHAPFTVDGQSGWLYWIKRERIERVRMYEPPPATPAAN